MQNLTPVEQSLIDQLVAIARQANADDPASVEFTISSVNTISDHDLTTDIFPRIRGYQSISFDEAVVDGLIRRGVFRATSVEKRYTLNPELFR